MYVCIYCVYHMYCRLNKTTLLLYTNVTYTVCIHNRSGLFRWIPALGILTASSQQPWSSSFRCAGSTYWNLESTFRISDPQISTPSFVNPASIMINITCQNKKITLIYQSGCMPLTHMLMTALWRFNYKFNFFM